MRADTPGNGGAPRSVTVIGAGIVGLSTAWYLQERGIEVTVVDRVGVGAGASWGNAGYIAPSLAIPLNEPRNLRYGLRSLPNPTAPLRVVPSVDFALWGFLARFAVNSRRSSWARAVRANLPLSAECMNAYDELVASGVDAPVADAPITAVFRSLESAEGLLGELRHFQDAGQPVSVTELTGAALREQVPLASDAAVAGVRVDGQRFITPGRFLQALGQAVIDRGAELHTAEVVDVRDSADGVDAHLESGAVMTADAAVIATGAWLSTLARRLGVRVPVQAGRGYSFSVPVTRPVPGPVYLPEQRVACAPLDDKLHVTGTMELRSPDAPASVARIDAIADSARPLLDGVGWDRRTDDWVGPRPLTPDNRPLVGRISDNGIYVAGGHGMWGITHGPITGRLLTEQISTGRQPAALRELDPLR